VSRPLKMPDADWSDSVFEEQFVSIRREFIRRGALAQLWRADGGLAISALPVVWLLGRGYLDGLSVSLVRLAWLAGISQRSAKRAVATLTRAALLRNVTTRGDAIRFTLAGEALWNRNVHDDRKTHFPGRIVASGLWRGLRRTERSTLLALTSVVTATDHEGLISCSGIAELTGIDRASASRAMRALCTPAPNHGAPVAILDEGRDGVGFELTDEWWALRA
jgi:hypothetical protein